VVAQVPAAFKHTTEACGWYRSSTRQLEPKLRELGPLRAGYAIGSQFVYSQHSKAMRFEGFSEEQVKAIPYWQVADCFSELERGVLAYTDGLVLEKGRIADGVFDCLKKHLSEVEILELTYVTCTYMMHAVMSRALKLEFDDVPERVVEVDAPEGATADVMGMVDKRKDAET
jgi:alkylhydroperoxidase family enzyme